MRRRAPARAAAVGMVVAALAMLTGCTVTTATPEATGRTAAPAVDVRITCPTASSVAGLTALPFALTATASTCTYSAGDAGRVARVTIRRYSRAAGTLTAARVAAKRSGTVSSAPDLGFEAFTVRSKQGACTAWVTAADGAVTSIAADRPQHGATSDCTVARSVVTLVGVAPTPVVSAITARSVTAARGAHEQWTTRLASGLGLTVKALPAATSGYLATGSGASFLDEARRVDPASTAVIVVSGTTDSGTAQLDVLGAATRVLSAARATAPRARLIVVGPVSSTAVPSDAVLALRDDLRRVAAVAGAVFVDPVAGDWPTGDAATTTKLLAQDVGKALRAGPICPADAPGASVAVSCDASKDVTGLTTPAPPSIWTPGTP